MPDGAANIIEHGSRPATKSVFGALPPRAPDALLALIALHAQDPRTDKIDLGVGVYRDAQGGTPVFAAVKAAERLLIEQQTTKTYLGGEGDAMFVERLVPIIFGAFGDPRLTGVQTP